MTTARHADQHPDRDHRIGAPAPRAAAEPEPARRLGPQDRPPRKPPRWVRWTVIPLLILVPIGYILISAHQSRDSGGKKESVSATALAPGPPSTVDRRIYQVPIPSGSGRVASLETNSWNVSALYVTFTTTPGGLDTFLAQISTSRSALADDRVAISDQQAAKVGWIFGPGRDWAGVALTAHGDKPDHAVTVNLTNPQRPTVYVVSTVNF